MTSSFIVMYILTSLIFMVSMTTGQQTINLHYSFTENNNVPLTLGNVAEDAGISTTGDVRYSFYGQATPHKDLFEIDASSGDLRVNIRVDRDAKTLCAGRVLCEVTLGLSANTGSQLQIITVTVNNQVSRKTKPYSLAEKYSLFSTENNISSVMHA